MIIKICSELEINKNVFEKFGYNLGCKRKKENHCDSLFLWSWRDSTREKSCNSMQSVKIINYPQTTLNITIKSNI